jgi:hypothetical protein
MSIFVGYYCLNSTFHFVIHYEKLHMLKSHYSAPKTQKTTHI